MIFLEHITDAASWSVALILVMLSYRRLRLAKLGIMPKLNAIRATGFVAWGVLYALSLINFLPFLRVHMTAFLIIANIVFIIELTATYRVEEVFRGRGTGSPDVR